MNYKIIKTDKSWIESNAVEQLAKVCNLKGIEYGVGYPDLHLGKTPVGAAFITKDIIYPHLIGNDIGCAISLYQTQIKKKKFKKDKVIKALKETPFLEPKGDYNFGTIGGGNHFLEFTSISEIIDKEEFLKSNLDKELIYIMVHSGSRGLGENILGKYIQEYSCQNGLIKGTEAFENYLLDHNKAVKFAMDSRDSIVNTIEKITKVYIENKVMESPHNLLEKINGIYVHRKGAASANYEYVVVAGSRGTASYVVKPIKSNYETAYSIAHGAGRKWKREGCKEKLKGKYLRKDIKAKKFPYELICNNKNLIYEEAPEAYKNIERVIEDLVEFGLIKVVAKLNPIITYKG